MLGSPTPTPIEDAIKDGVDGARSAGEAQATDWLAQVQDWAIANGEQIGLVIGVVVALAIGVGFLINLFG